MMRLLACVGANRDESKKSAQDQMCSNAPISEFDKGTNCAGNFFEVEVTLSFGLGGPAKDFGGTASRFCSLVV